MKKYTESSLRNAVKKSSSLRQTIENLGLNSNGGGNYQTIARKIKEYSIDTTHWLGRTYWIGKRAPGYEGRNIAELLILYSDRIGVGRSNIKRRLLREGIIKNICSECNLETLWRGKPLVLILDHINGDNKDYRLENLRLLCPNCASQLDTFAGRNRNVNGK